MKHQQFGKLFSVAGFVGWRLNEERSSVGWPEGMYIEDGLD